MSNPYPDSINSVGVSPRDYRFPTIKSFDTRKSKRIDLSRKNSLGQGYKIATKKDRNKNPNKSMRKKKALQSRKCTKTTTTERCRSTRIVMLKATLLDIPKEERQNKDKKQQPQKRMNNTANLQLPDNNPLIRNSHAQEDSNGPIPQFTRDNKDRDFGFVFAGKMQLHEE